MGLTSHLSGCRRKLENTEEALTDMETTCGTPHEQLAELRMEQEILESLGFSGFLPHHKSMSIGW